MTNREQLLATYKEIHNHKVRKDLLEFIENQTQTVLNPIFDETLVPNNKLITRSKKLTPTSNIKSARRRSSFAMTITNFPEQDNTETKQTVYK